MKRGWSALLFAAAFVLGSGSIWHAIQRQTKDNPPPPPQSPPPQPPPPGKPPQPPPPDKPPAKPPQTVPVPPKSNWGWIRMVLILMLLSVGAYWIYVQFLRSSEDRTSMIQEPFKPDFDFNASVTPEGSAVPSGQYYDPIATGMHDFYGRYGAQGYYDPTEWQPRLALPAPPPKPCPYEKYGQQYAYRYIARKCTDKPREYRKALADHHPDANRFGSCDVGTATDRYSEMSTLCAETKGCKTNAYSYGDQEYHARNCNQDPEQFLRVTELNDSERLNPDCFDTATKRTKNLSQTCGWMPILGPNNGQSGEFYDPVTQQWFVKVPYADIQWPQTARDWAEYDRQWKGVDTQEKIFPAVYYEYDE